MPANEHIYDSIPDYALGLLDEADKASAAEHLKGCASCQAELADYQAVLAQLPLAVPGIEPPAHLKQQILAQIQPAAVHETPVRLAWWQELRNMFQRRAPAWAFVGLALVVFLGVLNLVLWNQVKSLTQTAQEPVMQVVRLASTDIAPEASGLLVISKNGRYGTLVVDNLPDLDENQQYQLWLIRDGERSSGGVFSVSGSGYGVMEIDAPDPLSSYPAFGVTIEPAGGSPGPTGDKVLGGDL